MLTSSTPTNLRGLCPVTDSVVWVCGNYGYIGISTDAGTNWTWNVPKGYEKSDFRDIEAFDDKHAVVMASGYPAVILYTENGGADWTEAYRSDDTLAFFDAIDFWDTENGVCIGDWLNNEPYTLLTNDGGKSWTLSKHPTINPMPQGTVASFAASGTCVRAYKDTAGKHCFIYAIAGVGNGLIRAVPDKNHAYTYSFIPIPYESTAQSQGIFSLSYDSRKKTIWVAGGDYSLQSFGFSGMYDENKNSFNFPQGNVAGYRSCIEFFTDGQQPMLIACGLNGADIAPQQTGTIWHTITTVPLNSAIKAKKGNAVYLCGPRGTIYKLEKKL